MRQLFWALLFLSAYVSAEEDVPHYDFRAFPAYANEPRYEDRVRYDGREYTICYETFVTGLLESEGVLDDIKAQVSDMQRGYSSVWAIKNGRLFLTGFSSVSDLANQQIRQLIDDNQAYLPADWYTGEVYLLDPDLDFYGCNMQPEAGRKNLSISGGAVLNENDISYEEFMQAMRDVINLDERIKSLSEKPIRTRHTEAESQR